MTPDRFIADYIKAVKDEIAKLKDDLAVASISSLYDLGRIQGRVTGLQASLDVLESTYAEQDK